MTSQSTRRYRGARALAALLPKAAGAVFRRRGFAEANILTHWPDIVGAQIAADTAPQRLIFPTGSRRGGTLHVHVAGALATELQHLEPLVVERINTFFGYGAVARFKLVQAPLPPAPQPANRAQPLALDAAEEETLRDAVAGVDDEGLRRALAGLGRVVLGSRKSENES